MSRILYNLLYVPIEFDIYTASIIFVVAVLAILYIGYRMGIWYIKDIIESECSRYCKVIMNNETADEGQKLFAKNLITHFKNTIIYLRMDDNK